MPSLSVTVPSNPPPSRRPQHNQGLGTKLAVAAVLMVVTSAQPIFATISKVDGKFMYNYTTVPLLSELLKLLMSACMLLSKVLTFEKPRPDNHQHVFYYLDFSRVRVTVTWGTTVRFLVPSLIYVLINNISFMALEYMTPSTWQILNNLKILTAGIASRVFLNRRLTELQWIALIVLLLGVTTSQISAGSGDNVLITPVIGYAIVLLGAVLSAMAAVYTEFILKQNDDSLDWQQLQLYIYGSILNMIGLTINDFKNGYVDGVWTLGLFKNYNFAACLCVVNMSFAGILTSWVFKFADTIMKVFASSMAMMLTTVVSICFFDQRPSLQLFLGISIATLAVRLYYYELKDSIASVPVKVTSVQDAPRTPRE